MRPRLAFIPNLNPPAFPFAHRHFGLPRRIVAGSLHLQVAILVTHHPIIGNTALVLQTKYLLQLARARRLAVIVFGNGGLVREARVVLGQILRLQKNISGLVRADFLAPHFLDQPILMGAMAALDASFGLR